MTDEKDSVITAEEISPKETEAAAETAAEEESNICTDAFAEGEAQGRAAAAAEIAALRQALAAAEGAAARRESEVICGRLLRERHLDESLTEVILPEGAGAVPEETLAARADAVARAVREAAIAELRQRAAGIRPGSGEEAPLTGAMIRELPLARLAELQKGV